MLRIETVVTTAPMHYDAATRTLSAEHSDLGSPPLANRLLVRSHRTNQVVTFTLVARSVDPEGELQYTLYRGENGLRLKIWND